MLLDDIQAKITQIQGEQSIIEGAVKGLITPIIKELDLKVGNIRETIKQYQIKHIPYPLHELEEDFTELTTLIYKANGETFKLLSALDIAKQTKINSSSREYLNIVEGTIKEKEAQVNLLIGVDISVENIYNRAYKEVKQRCIDAEILHTTLKKIYTTRVVELEIFRKETDIITSKDN